MLAPDMALAGTTGGLTGTVVDTATGKPVAGATVTATSPSQTVSQKTDASGHYSFLSLAPDTYTVSVQDQGYQAASQQGITIAADTTASAQLQISQQLRTIGRVAARSQGSLVRAGTTADVYNVNAAQQRVVAAAGGGATQDSAFSALSTVPGVAVAPGQAGYIGAGPTLSIRGGDYDQIGYQFDGIPINRSFDNYPSGETSSLGQQELQVYTGAPPPGTVSEGISGYINQVIKTGTNPGFVSADIAIGTPYYHKAAFEAGGTALNNRFSYYVGVGGFNQSQRYADNFDGASLSNSYGYPVYGGNSPSYTGVYTCQPGLTQAVAPSCYVNGKFTPEGNLLGPFNAYSNSQVADRDTVVNFHYYLPHKDGTRDDIQALFDNSSLNTEVYSSANDIGGVGFAQNVNVAFDNNFGAPPGFFAANTNISPTNGGFLTNGKPFSAVYVDGYQLGLPTGGFLPANYRQYASIYYFPNSAQHTFNDQINPAERDGYNNDQSIEKLQFTKSLGSNAFFRAYGYGFYSDWLNTGPNSAFEPGGAVSYDYELSSHARGAGFTFQDQATPQNLISFSGDYSTASVLRDNNTEFFDSEAGATSPRAAAAVLVSSANPTNGVCYSPTGAATQCYADPTHYNAFDATANPTGAQIATIQQIYNGAVTPITAPNCGGAACQYLILSNGQYATYNSVTPNFYGLSINDEIKPIDKLTFNLGLRLDDYQFVGGNTQGTAARTFLYNAYNSEMCESTTTQGLESKTQLGIAAGAGCATAGAFENVNFTNPTNQSDAFPVFQPRVGLTYSVTPRTVLRAAYGRYAQPPNTAYEQYDTLQQGSPATLYGTYGFQAFGFTSPFHGVVPSVSNNYDFSIEQELPGQVSFKISPFLRKTQGQYQQFFLNQATAFVSGLPVGNQTSQGVEFELDKGNFANEGLSAKLAFAYTNSYIKYNTLSNGTTVLSPVVNAINAYNALTKAGGGARCYTLQNAAGTGGVADPTCAAGSIANPYYNAPEQNANAFNSSVNYVPYDTIPAGLGVSAIQYGYPYVASLVLQEKIKHFSISPIVQFFGGQRYGAPLATAGIDPTTCTAALTSLAAGDPRYTFGSAGGLGYNATSCGQLGGGIPNLQTGAFDGLGAYSEPSQILLNAQFAFEFNKNVGITVNLANIVNTCFGGSKVPWAVKGACGYTNDQTGSAGQLQSGVAPGGIGNTYNPGDAIQPSLQYSYDPYWTQQPLGIYAALNLKL